MVASNSQDLQELVPPDRDEPKVEATLGALRTGLISTLVTDRQTALAVLGAAGSSGAREGLRT